MFALIAHLQDCVAVYHILRCQASVFRFQGADVKTRTKILLISLLSSVIFFLTPETWHLVFQLTHPLDLRHNAVHNISGCSQDKIIADFTG
jgi:hypothetical protein